MPLRMVALEQLTIDDEASMAAVPLYRRLKRALLASGHRFCVPAPGTQVGWDRAVFLNLTYWSPEGVDVLCEDHLAADVVAHVAWHEVIGRHIAQNAATAGRSVTGLLFAESVASAFDLFLLG